MFKYLFKALLSDGSIISGNQEDKGSVEGKNCYYDVLQAEKEGKLRAFAIYDQENGNEYLIDIGGDCHFEANILVKDENTSELAHRGTSFFLHDNLELSNIRLIWYFQRKLVLDIVNSKISSNNIESYTLGFQGNLSNGKNREFKITLK